MIKEYYSKLYHKWKPLKSSDSEFLLRKYKYKIQQISTTNKIDPRINSMSTTNGINDK